MKWLAELFEEIGHELRLIGRMFMQANTWIVIGVLAAFGVVMYFGTRVAMRYDGLLQMLGAAGGHCRTLTNSQYLGLIYLLFFFAIAMIYCLGNLFNYLSDRGKKKYGDENRRLFVHALLGGIATVIIGGIATWVLSYWC